MMSLTMFFVTKIYFYKEFKGILIIDFYKYSPLCNLTISYYIEDIPKNTAG